MNDEALVLQRQSQIKFLQAALEALFLEFGNVIALNEILLQRDGAAVFDIFQLCGAGLWDDQKFPGLKCRIAVAAAGEELPCACLRDPLAALHLPLAYRHEIDDHGALRHAVQILRALGEQRFGAGQLQLHRFLCKQGIIA